MWIWGEAFEDEMQVSVAIEVTCLGVQEADEVFEGECGVALLEEEEVFEGLLLEELMWPLVGDGGLPIVFAGFVGSYEGSDAIAEVYITPTVEWIVLLYCRLENRSNLIGRNCLSVFV